MTTIMQIIEAFNRGLASDGVGWDRMVCVSAVSAVIREQTSARMASLKTSIVAIVAIAAITASIASTAL